VSSSGRAPARLLILDDDRDILAGTRRFFERRGYVVDCAVERAAAETLLAHNHYHCLVVEPWLEPPSEGDHLEVVGRFRGRSPLAGIVVLTGAAAAGLEEAALRQGADVFLRKPQRLPHLARIIERLVGAQGAG
jgi:ActR/RegA family two-component response regulator